MQVFDLTGNIFTQGQVRSQDSVEVATICTVDKDGVLQAIGNKKLAGLVDGQIDRRTLARLGARRRERTKEVTKNQLEALRGWKRGVGKWLERKH